MGADKTEVGVKRALELLRNPEGLKSKAKKVLLWLDGYIDYKRVVVRVRHNPYEYEPMKYMSELANRIGESAGSSLSIEWVLTEVRPGGFVSNTGWALEKLEVPLYIIACYGKDHVNPVFKKIVDKAIEAILLDNPGETQAIEFKDGKVMLMDFADTLKIDWDLIMKKVGREKLIELVEKVDLFGQGYWSMIPNMDNIWRKLQEEILPSAKIPAGRYMFLDLADVKKRPKEQLLEAFKIISGFEDYYNVIVSFNESEAEFAAQALGIEWRRQEKEKAENTARILREKININQVVIHTTRYAVASSPHDIALVDNPYEPHPVVTTAGGDNFNAGYIFATLNEVPLEAKLIIGNATAGFFIRKGDSPSLEDLKLFIEKYMDLLKGGTIE